MQIGYILLDKLGEKLSAHVLIKVQAELSALRDDQRRYVEHLVRSWRRLELDDVRRAIKRTLADRP